MLGVEFEKIKNVTFLIYNEGTFLSKKDLQLHTSLILLQSKISEIWHKNALCISFESYFFC